MIVPSIVNGEAMQTGSLGPPQDEPRLYCIHGESWGIESSHVEWSQQFILLCWEQAKPVKAAV